MFKNFRASFKEFKSIENTLIDMKGIPFKYSELLLEFGGKSFDSGLYTIHSFEDSLKWTKLLSEYFKGFKEKMISFGHDWMGRQFFVATQSKDCIYMFDPATLADFYIDEDLLNFHESVLPGSKVNNLASDLFEDALSHLGISGIDYNECLGFKTPLFLNGKEEVSNYHVIDTEVYWELEYQLYHQIKNLPEGTRIQNISINPFSQNDPTPGA